MARHQQAPAAAAVWAFFVAVAMADRLSAPLNEDRRRMKREELGLHLASYLNDYNAFLHLDSDFKNGLRGLRTDRAKLPRFASTGVLPLLASTGVLLLLRVRARSALLLGLSGTKARFCLLVDPLQLAQARWAGRALAERLRVVELVALTGVLCLGS
jgi:hypothetical protein